MKLNSPSRIHMGLIDLNGELGRVDGGVGVALDYPNFQIEGKESSEIEIDFRIEIDEKDKENLESRIKNAAKNVLDIIGETGISLKVNDAILSHSGLGSGTQVSLSTGKITSLVYGIDLNAETLAKITGRGGTSGIGVAAFETGGFIVDGGHTFGEGKDKIDFRPSSASKDVKPSPVLFRHDFDWDIVLTIPKGEQVCGDREVDIFRKFCPVPTEDVQKICRLVLMKMMPAVIEKDFDSFGKVVNELQNLGFKRAEVGLQKESLKGLLSKLQEVSYSGISSFGPTIYSLGDKDTITEISNEFFDKFGIEGEIISTKANNSGYEIIK
ncbi:beta-ribofuranosylaminobenzene 5'-phosphate synthase [Methanococcus maripaludis]|uniref:Beta-ribofuranosylaminobenzene 5'-phosphate synthase n=2 Tax=Methanococcus maripaludis TaxID=39152 RepID=Q6M0J1_METMP|nr:beta-ribofuranosylaminobenzene 5'-phosphate synthase [Methanococcus maripaludis]MBA2846086.1 beta-ribofuranosylaminobenzene 5'-phosphate synthase [Methanococcus maripaludis]MBA2851319.1 beta-ribofuranosylaminobenzene 5'-phosphate synthase [Methanococcus maripaludis]MBA2858917.1 beta-ribofuranosylaminobenzene 5'-phosphate synthase [Methanococcus maripaludis]CAF29835.1 beta-ribofuranosylaminobenzene 5'-phosphate synthase [Methanococcus maripaludis S2]